MPIYEYECQVCGVHFERKQSVSDTPIQTCPECGGRVRKLFFPAGIIFKGSGFYKTDYASTSSGAKTEETAASSASSASTSESAKTEAGKPASTSEK